MVIIVLFTISAFILASGIGRTVVLSVTEPLGEVEKVAKELAAGNLHSTLEYHSDDEIGSLAHNIRKFVRILGSYVDDIGRAMQEFSSGNFDVQSEVEWKGDFTEILRSFLAFEESMTDTVEEIRHMASQVNAGAGQISATANDLAEGATEQAGAVEELTAAVEMGMLSGQTEIKTFTILRGLVSLYTNEKDLTKCGKWLTVYLKNGGDAADLFSPFARAIENAVSKNDKTA